MNSVADVWENIMNQLSGELSQTTLSAWFDELEPVDIQGNTLILYCGNTFKRSYIESLFLDNIKNALRNLFSIDFHVQILDEDDYQQFKQPETTPTNHFSSENFTFENFVVGPSNKLAYVASMNVANMPAANYNPLFIYGDSGLGKTHLIYAIANVIRKKFPTYKTVYTKGDDMANELIDSIQEGRTATAAVREKYRKAEVLLVDDVQFIAGKKQTQEEFFHAFNTLYESGRQIVLTSDRPPQEITMLEERLRTRFEWGLLVDVEPPDFETRMAIIRSKAASLGIPFPDTVSAYIAENVTANVRQIEGTINKVMAYKDLLQNNPDKATVKRAMKDIIREATEYIPNPDVIVNYVSQYYDIPPSSIRGQQRGRSATTARQVSIYLLRAMTNLSQDEIGEYFDGRDHSTIIYSIKQIEEKMKKSPAFAETVKEIKTNIASSR